jgi:hypothetical protein
MSHDGLQTPFGGKFRVCNAAVVDNNLPGGPMLTTVGSENDILLYDSMLKR